MAHLRVIHMWLSEEGQKRCKQERLTLNTDHYNVSFKRNTTTVHGIKALCQSVAYIMVLLLQNRKNDEASYEKMLKLRRDLNRACTILDMVKRREQSKKELLQLTVEVFEKRYDSQFNIKILNTFFIHFLSSSL